MVIIGHIGRIKLRVVKGLGVVNDRRRSSLLAANSVGIVRILEAIADLDLVLRVVHCVGRIDGILYTAAKNSAEVWQLMLRVAICGAAQ